MANQVADKLGKYTKMGTRKLNEGLAYAEKQLEKVNSARNAIVGTLMVVAVLGAGFIAFMVFLIGYIFGLGFKAA